MKGINATKFKVKWLALLEWVCKSSQALLITKHGKPVTEVSPASIRADSIYPQQQLNGSVIVLGDIVKPAISDEDLE